MEIIDCETAGGKNLIKEYLSSLPTIIMDKENQTEK
jgi:hypothetical protein